MALAQASNTGSHPLPDLYTSMAGLLSHLTETVVPTSASVMNVRMAINTLTDSTLDICNELRN